MAEFIESPIREDREEQYKDGKSVGVVSLQRPSSWKVYVNRAAD